jgi:hypothetical protein
MSYGKPNFMLRSKDIDPAELVDKVPYVGANQNVDIIDFGMSADFVDLNNPSVQSYDVGQLAWDTPEGTATFTTEVTTSFGLYQFNVHIGQQDFFLGVASAILESESIAAVYTLTAQGERPVVSYVDIDVTQNCIVGILMNSADAGEAAYVQTFGMVFNINTISFNVGDILYALTDDSGGLTTTPTNVYLGTVVTKSKAGSIFLNPKVFYNFIQFSDFKFSENYDNKSRVLYNRNFFYWEDRTESYTETNNGVLVTGTLSATITYAYRIVGGTLSQGDILRVRWRLGKTVNTANTTMAIFVNTTASLSGATAMGIVSNANGGFSQMKRDFALKSTGTECYPVTLTANTDDSTAGNAPATQTIDWTQSQYIIFSLQNNAIGDSSQGQFFNLAYERGRSLG